MRPFGWRKGDITRGILGWGAWGAASFVATHGKEAVGDRVDGWMVLGDGAKERA